MNPFITVTLAHHGLELRCAPAGLSEDRPFDAADCARLKEWSARYLDATRTTNPHPALLAIGQQIHDWLNGSSFFLARALNSVQNPALIEFGVSRNDCDQEPAKALLDAPWELLASEGRFWALRTDLAFCPVRRIGSAIAPPAPGGSRLGLVFMAAAPHGAENLDYEAEEASILTATHNLGLDLAVEESGTLDLLSACVAREKPDVIQISCHGTLLPQPGLLLEDDIGDPAFISADLLALQLASHHPRLLFLSACETAQADPVLPSLARSLVLAGTPAVLGWAAPVGDGEATLFASLLYDGLAKGLDLAHSLALARLQLADHDRLPASGTAAPRSRDWHLARLFLSAGGGGALATAGGCRRHLGQGKAAKAFLDTKGKQVPVAGELEFVGRRREIQKILREFRAPAGDRQSGVFIHGVGRQGKSSLAARVARRLEHTHETVVIYRRYDAPCILRTLAERLATPAVTEIVNRHLPRVDANKSSLLPALTELLEGPCAQAAGHGAKPVLLIIDDFEQALIPRPAQGADQTASPGHILKPDYTDSILALLLAFESATTDSLLLFTSRFQFTCLRDGRDLASTDHLLHVPLHGMNEREAQKQAQAKLRIPEIARLVAKLPPKSRGALPKQLARVVSTARGNPGLQDLLFTLAVHDPAACDRCLAQMETYLASGALPEKDAVREFLENVVLKALAGLLSPAQRDLLRASTLFELPVPEPVMRKLAESLPGMIPANTPQSPSPAQAATDRLLALGLWELYEDLHDPQTPALAVNALVRPMAGGLDDTEKTTLARAVTSLLFDQWGGESEGRKRNDLQECELTRLGLLARDAQVLAASGARALRLLDARFDYRAAAAWAKEILSIVDAAGLESAVDLLRTAAERCQQVGEVAEANTIRERAMSALGQGGTVNRDDHAATLITHARALVDQGQPDDALRHLEQARTLLSPGREHAIVLGEIARILAHKGDIDESLRLHNEKLAIVQSLGDKRGCAVTLCDIARIRTQKGHIDEGLRLHTEALAVFDVLGDKHSRAVTLSDIARIRAQKGDIDGALGFHTEALTIYESLGDKRERTITLGYIARILADKGDIDGALRLHNETLAVYEALGDKGSHAVSLGEIARIRARKGDTEEALRLHNERLAVFETLGYKRSCAVALGDIARIRAQQGDIDEALRLHKRRLRVFETLGDIPERAHTLWFIARLEIQHQQWQEAFDHFAESYSTLVRLGRLDGICMVGLDLGQLLCMAGQRDEGLQVLARSRDGFLKLGQPDMARQTQELMDQIQPMPPKP